MKKPFGLKLEIHDPELGGLLGGGPNRVLVSKNASIGNIRATTTDPAASKLGAIGEGGIEGKYRVSIFQGSAPLTHESFRSKKNAIAYAVDWKKRKDRNLGFSAKLRLRELAGKFHLPYSVAKKIVRGIKGRGVSIVRMRNEPSNVGYRGWGDVPVAKIERGSKRSPFADLLHEAGHVDAGHLGSKAKISERGAELLKGAEGYYPRAHHEGSDDILSAARSVLLREKQANRAAGKILKDSGASPEQISAFAQEQRKNFRTYRKNAWRHAVAGERIKNPSATESNVMGVLQRQAARRGVIPSDGALRSARESVQRQIRMNPINRGRDPIFGNESFGVDGSKSILPLTISEAKRIHKNTSKLWRVREFARGEYLRRLLGGFELIPARGAADAKKGAEKLRYYRSNPAGKEIDRVRKEILSDSDLAKAYRYKDTPGLTVVVDDEAHHFPKRSRDTKYVIDNLNKHAARGKSWSVGKGMLGQPLVEAKDIDRIL